MIDVGNLRCNYLCLGRSRVVEKLIDLMARNQGYTSIPILERYSIAFTEPMLAFIKGLGIDPLEVYGSEKVRMYIAEHSARMLGNKHLRSITLTIRRNILIGFQWEKIMLDRRRMIAQNRA